MNEIKVQKDANRELRQQLVPLMASQKNAWDAVKSLKEESDRARIQYEEHLAALEGRLSVFTGISSSGANAEGVRDNGKHHDAYNSDDENDEDHQHMQQLAASLQNSGSKKSPISSPNNGSSSGSRRSLRTDTDDAIMMGAGCGAWIDGARSAATEMLTANGIVLEGDLDDDVDGIENGVHGVHEYTNEGNRGCTSFFSVLGVFFGGSGNTSIAK
jgi:hypothetical protein